MRKHVYLFFGLLLTFLFLGYFAFPTVWHSRDDCANSISCIKDLSGKYKEKQPKGEFLGTFTQAPAEIAQNYTGNVVLGENTQQKKIFIDLTNQHLYAYEGNALVYDFLVSTGKWHETPTGTFHIWIKLRYTRMTGGNKAIGTFYDLPNVPYTMFLYSDQVPKSDGYGIHGAYWHNNFGHPMSHGCINISLENAATLYNWTLPVSTGYSTYAIKDNPGTEVIIYGDTPKS